MKKIKKKLKVEIAKVPKIRKFDLSSDSPEENTRIIQALESLKQNSGWIFLTQILEVNKNILAEQIINKEQDGKSLTDAEVDILRYKHSYLKELLEKPDIYLKKLKIEPIAPDDLDPYYKV